LAQALEWIRRGDPFDVAILDMQMPHMDGARAEQRQPLRLKGAARPVEAWEILALLDEPATSA
jgi:CheY-like chemotaxis protein